MAGTSLDAIDCALVLFDHSQNFQLVNTYSEPISQSDKAKLLSLTKPQADELQLLMEMDVRLGRLFSQAALNTLKKAKKSQQDIIAIGSHGQTIRHFPNGEFKTTLQIGDPNIIAELTGITTVADFRRRDMAAGGQGAPLVPPFHAALFGHSKFDQCVVNIGGIANITCLPATQNTDIVGFDTGPGNTLMDLWCSHKFKLPFDKAGQIARKGKVIPRLLEKLLADNYFSLPSPKSTGREYFGELWLTNLGLDLKNAMSSSEDSIDVLTTLTELTAITISEQINTIIPNAKDVLICGGGYKNEYLLERLEKHLQGKKVCSTADYGLPPEWVESSAFAWLAMKTINNQAGNLPSVTGANKPVILGAIYPSHTCSV